MFFKRFSRLTPLYVNQGPFPSPYSQASKYDNQILVATGVGITPALAAISAFKTSRRINLIWAVRDAEMLE
jgi:ferredoxin-NADP reductase